jgi:hypothetical protein
MCFAALRFLFLAAFVFGPVDASGQVAPVALGDVESISGYYAVPAAEWRSVHAGRLEAEAKMEDSTNRWRAIGGADEARNLATSYFPEASSPPEAGLAHSAG